METITTDICVIGAGAGGLSVAAGAAQLGVDTVLVEQGAMGGDCLNTGCVPSKTLLHLAEHYAQSRDLIQSDVAQGTLTLNFGKVMERVKSVIAEIAPMDSVTRFTDMGVRVIQASAAFESPTVLNAGDYRIQAKRFVIATGSHPFVPKIKGLDGVPYLTNETLFALKTRPQHLVILGGGAVGLEMAQGFRRLGARVTLLERDVILAQEDRDMVEPIKSQLADEGVHLVENCNVTQVKMRGRRIDVVTKDDTFSASHVLVACGRQAATSGLKLDRADVALRDGWVQVDERLRTSNKNIFALGDAIGGAGSTHRAGYHAGIIIRNALFFMPTRVDERAIPVAVYTAPEFARIGLNETQARSQGLDVSVIHWPFAENDRATTEGDGAGRVKVIAQKNGKLLGAAITGAAAGDLLTPWLLALSKGLKLSDVAGLVVPYPTRSEASKRAASDFYARKLFTPLMRQIVAFLGKFRN